MVEHDDKEVKRKVEQGRSTNMDKCITGNNACKVDTLVRTYNELTNEQEQEDFIIGLPPDDFYILASNKKLGSKHIKAVYYYKAHIYYNKAKYTFSKYYCYCKIFQYCITDWEKELLIKKLMRPKHAHMIQVACKELKFLRLHNEKLQAGYLAHQLSIIDR